MEVAFDAAFLAQVINSNQEHGSSHSSMNPLQFKGKSLYQSPIITVNLPKWQSHSCINNDKRSLTLFAQLDDGAIEWRARRLRVAFQGVRGAYSESAAKKAYPNCEAVPCQHFENCFQDLERSSVDRAVLPIENSLGGSIHRNYDLLLRYQLHIVGEVNLPISHCLLANPGVKVGNLKRVVSHQQALAQCEYTLTNFGLVREAMDDTAGAAKYVAIHKLEDVGAVASITAAKIYGLNILARDIQDDSDNVTRFLMLARKPILPGTDKPFKTSIVFSLEEGPGMLCKALTIFDKEKINLTKIESRPLQKQALHTLSNNTIGFPGYFGYIFYVDFEASMAENRAQEAIGLLKEFAKLRVLGSYPVDNSLQ